MIGVVELSTKDLENQLLNTKTADIDKFFKDNSDYMIDDSVRAFEDFFKDTARSKRIKFKDIYLRAGFSESYGEKLLSGETHTTDRDRILRLCIAGHFSINETDKALNLYKMNPLYPKDKRDACIIVKINNKKYDLDDIDDALTKQNLQPLMRWENKNM